MRRFFQASTKSSTFTPTSCTAAIRICLQNSSGFIYSRRAAAEAAASKPVGTCTSIVFQNSLSGFVFMSHPFYDLAQSALCNFPNPLGWKFKLLTKFSQLLWGRAITAEEDAQFLAVEDHL